MLSSTLGTLIRNIITERLEDDERLDVKPFDQTKGYCGPASLKMVLRFFGDERTEKEIAKIAGSTRQDGTPGENLIVAARALGYDAVMKDEATIEDLVKCVNEDELPVIVNWFSTDDGHYSVVVGIDEEKREIKLQDPEIRKMRTLPLDEFENVWFDFDSDIPENNSFNVRRMIVIKPSA